MIKSRLIIISLLIAGMATFSCSNPSNKEDKVLEEEEHLDNIEHVEEDDSVATKEM